ncbi:MAG: alkylation repair protein [Firmicutes bacterium]|nr:alkylation repair protein [Bacillota bacterium]
MYDALCQLYYENRNLEQAVPMAAYMKNNFPFLGIAKPRRTVLHQKMLKQAKQGRHIDWEFVFRLWAQEEREFQYFAVDYLIALKNELKKEDIEKLEKLITTKPWWDTVDSLAGTVTGELCAKYGELIGSAILPWAEVSDLWLKRTAILFQLKYKDRTNTEVLSQVINSNLGTKEFFINKAIGWALREYSKTNPSWVKAFIENNNLHPLSVREGSKYIK